MKYKELKEGSEIPAQRYTIKTKLFPYQMYRLMIEYGSGNNFDNDTLDDRQDQGRVTFYSQEEYDNFIEFLKSKNIEFYNISNQEKEQYPTYKKNYPEEDTYSSRSPLPSPGYRDIF